MVGMHALDHMHTGTGNLNPNRAAPHTECGTPVPGTRGCEQQASPSIWIYQLDRSTPYPVQSMFVGTNIGVLSPATDSCTDLG